jgi:hypothetical protein
MRYSPGYGAHLLDHSPYEDACGIRGKFTLQRRWCTRFLRGIGTDGIWLGPELLARVDRRAVDALCETEPFGEALRLVAREGVTLGALEEALAPVLASEQDWKEAAERDRLGMQRGRPLSNPERAAPRQKPRA